jgi:tripartite-type tricarboxylate transporter receptor subunit TctC
MSKWFRSFVIAGIMCAAANNASAQSSFPAKAVHIFVPYAAGGAVDILARTLGDVVSRQWGQSVVIENRPGAGGVLASQALAASPADGYTLIVVASGHATNAFLYPKLPYDTFTDFTPISLLGSSPNILLVRKDSPFKTLGDIIATARAKPASLSFGHAGNGTSTHLAGELLKSLARIDINAIPYKGGVPAINDLLGGQIPMSFNNGPESVGQIEADLTAKLSRDFVAALNTEPVKERLAKLGASPIGSSPQQFDAKIHADYDKWGPIIKASGMKAE